MTWKTTSHTSSTGDSATFAAEDINKLSRMLNGEDVDDVTIGLDWTFGSGKLNTPNIKNTGTLTLPTATDTLVGRATTDTLTNKTLTTPIISSISNSGTITVPTGTDTLVGKATTDTLTNKTLTSPTINTPTLAGSGGTLTLPAGPDTLVARDTIDTLTNKTLTLPVISAVSNSGTITFPTGSVTLASLTGSETLTNKTLTNPTISQITSGGSATTFYRAVNTADFGVGIKGDLNNSASAQVTYGNFTVAIEDNTASSEKGYILAQQLLAGSLQTSLKLPTSGVLEVGVPGTRYIRLSPSGLSAARTITFNDANTIVVGEANTQTLTNKTLTTPTVNGIKGGDVAITNSDSPYTALATTRVIRADATSGAITINLPTAVGIAGFEYHIFRTDVAVSTNIITIDANSTETIDSSLTYRLYPAEYVKLESDGANWQVISRPSPSLYGYYMLKNTSTIGIVGGMSCCTATGMLISTTSPATGSVWAYPIVVAKTTKFSSISFSVTSVSTTGKSHVGIYADNGNNYPGVLIFDSGEVDTTGTGIKTTTITSAKQIFQPGLYWVCYEQDTSTGQYRILPNLGTVINIMGESINTANNSGWMYILTRAYANTYPDPFTAGATLTAGNSTVSTPLVAVELHPV